MSTPDHNVFDNEGYDFDQWTPICRTCLKTVSSSRPPVYNADNCCCTDLSGFTNGPSQIPWPPASPGQLTGHGFQYQRNGAAYYPPQSYASSTASVPCPEGVEGAAPNLQFGNTYLPIAPEIGLGEIQHRRSASVHSNMSEQMRRFLIDQRNNQPRQDISPVSDSEFLKQDLWIQSQAAKKGGKERKKRSERSLHSGSESEEYGFVVGADAMAFVGEWVEERVRFDGGCYEMTLSDTTDELNGDD